MRKYVLLVTLALAVVALFALTVAPAIAMPNTYSPGYWKNHPAAWPGGVDIGSVHYSQAVALGYMRTPVRGDKSYTAFSIVAAIALDGGTGGYFWGASDWVVAHPPGSGIAANSPAWQGIEPDIIWLDALFD